MANKITKEQIELMNILYLQLKTYAAVARTVGCSPSTVKRYIIPGFRIVNEDEIIRFQESDLPEYSGAAFEGVENFGDLTELTEEEKEEIRILQKEVKI